MNLFCGVGRQQRRYSGLLVNNDLHSLYLHGLTDHLRRIPSKDGYLNNINLLNSRSQFKVYLTHDEKRSRFSNYLVTYFHVFSSSLVFSMYILFTYYC